MLPLANAQGWSLYGRRRARLGSERMFRCPFWDSQVKEVKVALNANAETSFSVQEYILTDGRNQRGSEE